jgi:hypothetical protein
MPLSETLSILGEHGCSCNSLPRWSVFDAPFSLNSTEQNEVSMRVDPLGILLAQSFANHSLQFGERLDFSGHAIVG